MQECSAVLREIEAAEATDAAVEDVVATYRQAGEPFPGIGHPFHKPVDPRAQRLFEIAVEEGIAGPHVEHLEAVQAAFEDATGKWLVINVTGVIAAVAADMGLPPVAARGLAVVSQAADLVAEVVEEDQNPIARDIWDLVEGQRPTSTRTPSDPVGHRLRLAAHSSQENALSRSWGAWPPPPAARSRYASRSSR